jgi:DNA-binding transcriptional ArsR family regulator
MQLPAHDSKNLHAALAYAAAGWEVYPIWSVDKEGKCTCAKRAACEDPGKHPATARGFKDASSDPERITEMFSRLPEPSIGLRTGRSSGVVALDQDPRHGGFDSLDRLEAEHDKMPDTRLHHTGGGGVHSLFQYPEGVELKSKVLAPGLELKAGTGIVLPPSNHASGGKYRALNATPLAPLPSWVLELILKPDLRVVEGEGQGEPHAEMRYRLPGRIEVNTRNSELCRYAGSLRAHGWEPADIFSELLKVNRERCVPTLRDGELEKMARQSGGWEKGNASAVAPEVRQAIAWLAQKAQQRFRRGLGAYSRWAVYRALLISALAHGWMIGDRAVAVRISVRELRKEAGLGSMATLHAALKALKEARLVYRVSPGESTMPGVLALRLPEGYKPEPFAPPLSAPSTGTALYPSAGALGALHQLRHGYGLGKLAGDVLERVVEAPGVSRQELAARLGPGRKPETLKRPLKQLREAGLVENRVRGRYWPVEGWQHVLDRVRTMSGERLAENLAQQREEREREAYRRHLAEKEESSEG